MDQLINRSFYFTLAALTLIAASKQWAPHHDLQPDLGIGPGHARAQSPANPPSFTPSVGLQPAASPGTTPMQLPTGAQTGAFAPPPPPSVPANLPAYPITVTAPLPTAPPTGADPNVPKHELENARLLARVNGEVILAGEIVTSVDGYMARNGYDPRDPALAEQREQFIRMRLQQLVETRIVVSEARRKIPEEGYKKAMEKFDEEFETTIIPQMLKDRKLTDVKQLEAALKQDGTTLEREKRNFAEVILRNSWIQQNLKVDQETKHDELTRYYQEHLAEFETPAQARWEQITVRFDAIATKGDAYIALAKAGNQIIDGRAFHETAREMSQGSTASQGGAEPWTEKGKGLVSKTLEAALFSLPVGQLSPILEDDVGFHIVRVVERQEASRLPFTDAQIPIRRKIIDQRTEIAKKEFVEDIKKRATVWTIYDQGSPAATAAQPVTNR